MRGDTVVNAIIAFLFAITGPVAIVLTIQQQGRLTDSDVASWMFGAFTVNGIVSAILCMRYRQPLVFLWTMPGSVLVGQALDHFSFVQIIATYYATGLFMLILGLSGLMRTCMNRISDAHHHGHGGWRVPAVRIECDLRRSVTAS